MTSSVKESGANSGEFLPSTITNIGNQERRAMEIMKNIDSNWNIAKRTIELLNEVSCLFVHIYVLSIYQSNLLLYSFFS